MTKKSILAIVAFLVLTAFTSCLLVEPALAYRHQDTVAVQDEGHCEFTCHSAHHPWIAPELNLHLEHSYVSSGILNLEFSSVPDTPVLGIFHPPLSR